MSRQGRVMVVAAAALALIAWTGSAQADDGPRGAAEPALLALEPIVVPIVDHGAMLGRLEVRAMWRIDSPGEAETAELRLPLLRAALVDAAAVHARLAAAPGQPVDPGALAARLGEAGRAAGFSGELLVLQASARAG